MPDGGQSTRRIETDDLGVAVAGTLVCQNFAAHPNEEVEMQSGPHDGVVCPECGRSSGLSVDYHDPEVTARD